jgi:prepilin-type N-terminal cleavage/methylation domain-containing protein
MKKGFSIIELLVVITIIASLVALAIPAINAMQKSFNSTGAEGMIGAALATARTLAISNQRYAGVRFQKAWKSTDDAAKANQYMIFIIYDEDMSILSDEFRAVEGYKPVKLPENTGVMDMEEIVSDVNIDSNAKLLDATRFSIMFSPAGKLVIHDVQTRNKDGAADDSSNDDVINTQTNVNNGVGMFVQDSAHKQSRNKFVIYDRNKFNDVGSGERYTRYLKNLSFVYVNAYTGELIKK